MKFIGQHIVDLIARFRKDVYLEDIDTGTIVSGGNLGLDSNNKIVKNAVSGGTTDLTSDVTGILPVANGGTGQNSLGSVNISSFNNDSGFTANTGDITGVSFRPDDGNTTAFTSGSADFILVGGTGVATSGDSSATLTLAVDFADNEQATFGANNDLKIYHNSSLARNIIDNDVGDLYINQNADDKDIVFRCDDGSGGTTTYLTLDGSTERVNFNKPIKVSDNTAINIGSGLDLRLSHDGTDSTIRNYAGDLKIIASDDDKDIIFQCDDGSGGVTPYLTIDGSNSRVQFDANLYVPDSVQLRLGSGNDLRLYHSTDSYISNEGTGDLYIQNSTDDKDILFRSDDGSGGLETYFFLDGSNGLTTFPDNKKLGFGNASDLRIQHDGSDSYISQVGTGDLYIQNSVDDKDIIFQSDDGSGGVAEYFRVDGGSEKTIYTKPISLLDSVGVQLGTGTDAQIYHTGSEGTFINYTGNFRFIQSADDADLSFHSDDGSGGTATYFYLDGGNTNVRFEKDIFLLDDVKLRIGSDTDLEIYNDGTDSYLHVDSGDLIIEQTANDKDIIFKSDDGSGGVETYFFLDGSNSQTTFQNNLKLEDNHSLRLGNSNDLSITHNGSNSIITNTNGHIEIINKADDKDIILKSDDGSGGVTAYLTLDGSAGYTVADKDIYLVDDVRLRAGTGGDFSFFHDGSNSKINNNTGNIRIENFQDDGDIQFFTDDGSGGTTVYLTLDGGTTHSYFSAGNVGIGTSSPGELLEVYKNGGDVAIKVHEDAGTHEAKIHLRRGGADWELINTNDFTIECESSEKLRIKTDGKVGIGTTSPDSLLEISSSSVTDFLKLTSGGSSANPIKLIFEKSSSEQGIIEYNRNGDLEIYNNDSDGGVMIDGSASGGADLYVSNAGNVGIGISNPAYVLDTYSGVTNIAGRFKSGDNQAWISVQDDDSGTYGALFGTDSDAGLDIILADSSANKRLVINSSGNVGVGTTSPSEKLEVDGNIKVSGNLDIGGSVQKQIQVFPMNFVDDLGTDKHFMPFVTNAEQTVVYQEEAAMVMPADGRVVSVTVHYAQMHGSDGNITVGIETSACGQSYTNAWTIEETETIAASVADDHHVFHFAFDNAKHFDSTDKMAISIQQSTAMQNAGRFFWVTAVIEYDWSTFLGGTSAEYTTTP